MKMVVTIIAESVHTNTRFARAIHRITVSIDRTSSRDITSIEPPRHTAAAKNTGSSNDRLVVIIIAVPGRVSGVVITVPGRISGVIVSAPAAVSVGQPHSAAVSAGEILTSTMRRR